jgi:GNAT superfamily N-acetyltransferase
MGPNPETVRRGRDRRLSTMQRPIPVRPATEADRPTVLGFHREAWGGPLVVAHDTVFDLTTLTTLVAEGPDGRLTGVLAYQLDRDSIEVVSIQAVERHGGVGTALLDAAVDVARAAGCWRLWLVTTNDNLDALRFYQRRGLRITRVDSGAVDRARQWKPTIPAVGGYGIPLHDELTLELTLA